MLMEKQLSRKEEIKLLLGDDAYDILKMLAMPNPPISCSKDIATYVLANPKNKNLLMEYRAICCKDNDENYPVSPVYQMYVNKIYDLSEDVIVDESNLWLAQWEDWRKSGRKNASSVIYKKDYLNEFITCPKYPIIAHDSLGDFLYYTDLCLQKCDNWGAPEFGQTTFVQPMYGQTKDGKLLRFMRVVELTNCEKQSGTMKKVPTFDFSVSVKIMPDNDLEHSTCLLRFDSKEIGHTNVFGEKSFEMSDVECKEHLLYDRLYHVDKKNEAHFHFFDKTNQLIYVGRPTSANSVSLSQLIKLGKNEYNDNTAFCGMPNLIVNNPAQVKRLVKLKDTLHLAHTRLDGKRYGERRASWRTQLEALKQTIDIIDNTLSIYPEQELASGREDILGNGYVDYDKLEREECKALGIMLPEM